MKRRRLAAFLLPLLLAAAPGFVSAQTTPGRQAAPPRQTTALQRARVLAARETAQVRLLERTNQLRPLRVSDTCADGSGTPRLTVLADVRGTPRLVRYSRALPDNSVQFTGYYDGAGGLRYATARASGLTGVLYSLTAEYDARGRLLRETGIRRPGYTAELRRLPNLNVALLRRGLCPA